MEHEKPKRGILSCEHTVHRKKRRNGKIEARATATQ